MTSRLVDHVDFGFFYDIEIMRYTEEELKIMNYPREKFVESCIGLPSIGFEIDGKMAGGAYIEHDGIHLVVHPDYHGRWGRLVRPTWEWMLSVRDPVYMRVEKFNTPCRQFLDHAGWPCLGEEGDFIVYYATKELLKPKRHRRPRASAGTSPAENQT